MATQMYHEVFLRENAWPPRHFREKKQQQSQVRLNKNVFTDRRQILFRWKKKMKIGGDKMRNASGQQGENEQQWKKANRNTSNKTFGVHIHVQHFLHKICN